LSIVELMALITGLEIKQKQKKRTSGGSEIYDKCLGELLEGYHQGQLVCVTGKSSNHTHVTISPIHTLNIFSSFPLLIKITTGLVRQ